MFFRNISVASLAESAVRRAVVSLAFYVTYMILSKHQKKRQRDRVVKVID